MEENNMAKSADSLNKKLLAAAISATKARDIKDLLDKGADVNAHNEWGLTPVMLAAQYNHSVAVLNALIAAGADIHEAEPKYRSNALHLAANSSKNPKVIEALLAAGANIPCYIVEVGSWYPGNTFFVSTLYLLSGTVGRMVMHPVAASVADALGAGKMLLLFSVLLFGGALLSFIVLKMRERSFKV